MPGRQQQLFERPVPAGTWRPGHQAQANFRMQPADVAAPPMQPPPMHMQQEAPTQPSYALMEQTARSETPPATQPMPSPPHDDHKKQLPPMPMPMSQQAHQAPPGVEYDFQPTRPWMVAQLDDGYGGATGVGNKTQMMPPSMQLPPHTYDTAPPADVYEFHPTRQWVDSQLPAGYGGPSRAPPPQAQMQPRPQAPQAQAQTQAQSRALVVSSASRSLEQMVDDNDDVAVLEHMRYHLAQLRLRMDTNAKEHAAFEASGMLAIGL